MLTSNFQQDADSLLSCVEGAKEYGIRIENTCREFCLILPDDTKIPIDSLQQLKDFLHGYHNGKRLSERITGNSIVTLGEPG